MQTITDVKRRVLQTAAEKLGKAERVAKDESMMKVLLENFKKLEVNLKQLYDQLKANELAEQKAALSRMNLAQSMANTFADMADLQQASIAFQETMIRANEVINPSVAQFVEHTAFFALDLILNERIPQLKRRILEHKNLETDLSSYSRRVKTLMDKPDGGANNAELVKLKEKLMRVDAEYSQFHDQLVQDLLALEEERVEILRPLFASQLVALGERQRLVYHDLHAQIHRFQGKFMMEEVEEMVNQGGPERDGGLLSRPGAGRKTLTFKGLFKSSAPQPQQPQPQQQQQAFATPIVIKQQPSISNLAATAAAAALPLQQEHEAVVELPPPPPPLTPPVSSPPPLKPGTVCIATFDYHGPDEGDLSFKQGQRVTLVEELSKGWWNGKLGEEDGGAFGLFPETYVTAHVPPPPQQ